MEWRLIDDTVARAGPANMAIDQALLESVQAGGRPALRFYRWRPACLSFGRNQPARGLCDPARAAARGVDIVRRPTGGLAVLHDRELTYAAVLPVGLLGSPRETYRALNRALVEGLRRLGLPAELAPAGGAGGVPAGPAPAAAGSGAGAGRTAVSAGGATGGTALTVTAACFQAPAPGEVVVAGRKLVGSAQRVERRAILQHGSLLLEGDQSLVAELVAGPPPPAPATLAGALGRTPEPEELVEALRAGFESALGIRLVPGALSAAERERAQALEAHFASDAWTWRC
ncbi:MAG: biotin/lipoate A/B protein ligase family protein [bacterium]|nr:MAG: hypothetical protein DIU52_01740 [bacterium]